MFIIPLIIFGVIVVTIIVVVIIVLAKKGSISCADTYCRRTLSDPANRNVYPFYKNTGCLVGCNKNYPYADTKLTHIQWEQQKAAYDILYPSQSRS